jgi:hypothetical protein
VIHNFRLEFDAIDENFPGLVINLGDKVLVVLMRLGYVATYIREDVAEDNIGSSSYGLVDFSAGLLPL